MARVQGRCFHYQSDGRWWDEIKWQWADADLAEPLFYFLDSNPESTNHYQRLKRTISTGNPFISETSFWFCFCLKWIRRQMLCSVESAEFLVQANATYPFKVFWCGWTQQSWTFYVYQHENWNCEKSSRWYWCLNGFFDFKSVYKSEGCIA